MRPKHLDFVGGGGGWGAQESLLRGVGQVETIGRGVLVPGNPKQNAAVGCCCAGLAQGLGDLVRAGEASSHRASSARSG